MLVYLMSIIKEALATTAIEDELTEEQKEELLRNLLQRYLMGQ